MQESDPKYSGKKISRQKFLSDFDEGLGLKGDDDDEDDGEDDGEDDDIEVDLEQDEEDDSGEEEDENMSEEEDEENEEDEEGGDFDMLNQVEETQDTKLVNFFIFI